ncbi:hypothetical protein BDF20DRAFT_837105 [Mycotypha africana]|uniref:uncharacterized protein n=1 Tax=Mycotypha africana TaxID=64632 RepID=UPI002301B6BC|nr:uncharacterized protein BDF20DRAFT_837105 [Mycotypha africana]KAI8975751.1 hypothetical protein BDF20DRAFT_837105 [Mycotypha africana]
MSLGATTAIWTQHCGIVSFHPLNKLQLHHVTSDHSLLACSVEHNLFPPILLTTIYAPAELKKRIHFYPTILDLPIFRRNPSFEPQLPNSTTSIFHPNYPP